MSFAMHRSRWSLSVAATTTRAHAGHGANRDVDVVVDVDVDALLDVDVDALLNANALTPVVFARARARFPARARAPMKRSEARPREGARRRVVGRSVGRSVGRRRVWSVGRRDHASGPSTRSIERARDDGAPERRKEKNKSPFSNIFVGVGANRVRDLVVVPPQLQSYPQTLDDDVKKNSRRMRINADRCQG